MKRVIKALPSIRFIIITLMVSLVLGVLMTSGFEPEALLGLVLGLIYLVAITMRNYDPMQWEAIHDRHAHMMRLQRDSAVAQLRSFVNAHESGDELAMARQVREAHQLLAEMPPPSTTAR